LNGKRHVWRIDFVDLAVKKMADPNVQRALVQLDLDSIVANVGQGETRLGVHPQQTITNVQLSARILVGPNVVGIRQRPVKRAIDPFILSFGLNGN
jgi:hypothetical protein